MVPRRVLSLRMETGVLLNHAGRVHALQFLQFVTVDVDPLLHISHLCQLQLRPVLRPRAAGVAPLDLKQLLLQIFEEFGQVDVALLLLADLFPDCTLLLHI